jgi:hypothetical protein
VLVVHLPLVLLMGGLLVIARAKDIAYSDFTRDAVTALDGAYYIGWLSNVGATLWIVGAAVSLFAAVVAGPRAGRGLLLSAGMLTAVLGVDDLFLLHDGVLPQTLGIREEWVMAAYGLSLGAMLLAYRREVGATCLPLLGLAVAFFATSILVDIGIVPVAEVNRHLAEDGAKLLGIASWSSWVVMMAARHVQGHGVQR